MVKLKDLISEWNDDSFKDLPKRWSNTSGLTEFEQQGGKDIVKEYKYGGIIHMKDQMKDGTFNPDNPDIHISGWGVLPLKSLHKWVSKHLKDIANYIDVVSDRTAKNAEKELYDKHSPLKQKVLALVEVHKYINSSQYKRAVTIYKKNKGRR